MKNIIPFSLAAVLLAAVAGGQSFIGRTNSVGQWEVSTDVKFDGLKGWRPFFPTNPPAFDKDTERVVEIAPLLIEKAYYQQFIVQKISDKELESRSIAIEKLAIPDIVKSTDTTKLSVEERLALLERAVNSLLGIAPKD